MTIFPDGFDSDLELPRVDKNVSEISGDAINSQRDAIFAIQRALGLGIQGTKPSLSERINVSIDANGFIKKSALEGIGLITLPIANKHVGVTAGIEESKLALDYRTADLNAAINSLRTDVTGISGGVSGVTAAFNLHVLGQARFHDGYHIKINLGEQIGVAGLEATTVGDAINEFSFILLGGDFPHIDRSLPGIIKHLASDISVNTTNFSTIDRAVTTVQEALDNIDATQGALGVSHVDEFHGNGILKQINSGTAFHSTQTLLDADVGAEYTEGTGVIKIPNVTSFASLGISTGDILQIVTQTGIKDVGTYQIRAVGPLTDSETLGDLPTLEVDELAIFHVFQESRSAGDKVKVNIYRPASVSSELAPLACAVRNNETIVDTMSVLPPNAARAVSIGFNGSVLNSDGYSLAIKAGVGDGEVRSLIIPDLHLDRLSTGQASPVDANSVAERINAYVSDPDIGHNFPITAYRIGNELAIAHNLVGPNYTLEIVDGYTANFALGLDAYGANKAGKTIRGSENNAFSVNGLANSTLRTVFDGYGKVSTDTSTFMLWQNNGAAVNPQRLGIKQGSVIHVTGHPTLDTNGSYTLFTSSSTSVSLFSAEKIDAPEANTTFNVLVTDAQVSLSALDNTETDQGIIQIAVDSNGKTLLHQRLFYSTTLGSGVEIVNVSNNFPVGDVSVLVGLDGDYINFNIIDDTLAGNTVRIHEDFRGSFKLYHPNNLDFMVVNIIPGVIPGGIDVVTVNQPLNTDEVLFLCSAHFNGTSSITHVTDTRLFGNLGFEQARSDLIEVFSQRPVADLRSNGVARGFDLLDIPYFESISSMEALPLQGGIAYVNGVRVAVETQKVIVSSFTEEGQVINNARRIIGVNEFGSIQVISDELGEILHDGYNASATFGKILPLYQVTVNNGGIDEVVDLRLFINALDSKLELIVDETNNIVGNFRSLEGALLYASRFPDNEKLTIKILNTVEPVNPITVPQGVTIRGNSPYGGQGRHRILNNFEHSTAFITLSGNNHIEDLAIESSVVGLQAPLVTITGSNAVVNRCSFQFGEEIASTSTDSAIDIDINASKNVVIQDNRIDNVYTGITSQWGCEGLVIRDNIITNLSGTGGISIGISISTLARPVDQITVENNTIKVPSVVQPADIRGVSVDVREAFDALRISKNTVLHEAENTMTNGIRVTSELDGGNGTVIKELFITENYIQGIKLDDNNVYGIYVNDVTNALVDNNTISRCGVVGAQTSDTALISFGDRVAFGNATNNVLKDSDILRGIWAQNNSGRVNIIGNIIEDIGTSAHYIRGNSPWSNISGNTLTGPGLIGIRWNAARTKISDNILNSKSATDYAFEENGILVDMSDIDIIGNTLTDFRFSGSTDNGTLISNNPGNATNDRLKIIGNTMSGDKIYKFIDLDGADHMISNNKMFNQSRQSAPPQSTLCINLAGVSNSLISGNICDGNISNGINSTGVISKLTITNNHVGTSLGTASITLLDNGAGNTVNECLIIGNRFPDKGSGASGDSNNIIGIVPASTVYNTNVIGINFGLQDTLSLPAASGVSGMETTTNLPGGVEDGYAFIPYWAIKDDNNYWEINRPATYDERKLYFPIAGIPNGAKLNSVFIQYRNKNETNPIRVNIFKRSTKSVDGNGNLLNPLVSSGLDTLPFSLVSNDQGNTSPGVEVEVVSGAEVINYAENNYFIQIIHSGNAPTNPDEVRIYGVTVKFTY